MHKDSVNPPGRPIVNGIDLVLLRLGQYIDTILIPMVTYTEEFLKDTKHIIQILENLKADVSSLYTIISHEDALS